ncbi:MAG: hypothetical protein KGD63_02410 [Candidatus Lokiarchaeota archaeon]|nr:hypothetical protein [Candidatus Lokiarchaeota archaeon]
MEYDWYAFSIDCSIDFGGQEQYRKEYLDKSEVFKNTDILIPIVDLHDSGSFREAKEYFKNLLESYKEKEKLKIVLFYHKYDVEDFDKDLLDPNVSVAKKVFEELFRDYDFSSYLTSIYDQDKLIKIFRKILISSYKELKGYLENAENILKEIKAKIIISDISGNIIVHNIEGVNKGLVLRSDLRDFVNSCNNIRENIFMSETAIIRCKDNNNNNNNKELDLYIFKYILAVLIMKSKKLDLETENKIKILLKDMELLAEIIVSAHME